MSMHQMAVCEEETMSVSANKGIGLDQLPHAHEAQFSNAALLMRPTSSLMTHSNEGCPRLFMPVAPNQQLLRRSLYLHAQLLECCSTPSPHSSLFPSIPSSDGTKLTTPCCAVPTPQCACTFGGAGLSPQAATRCCNRCGGSSVHAVSSICQA